MCKTQHDDIELKETLGDFIRQLHFIVTALQPACPGPGLHLKIGHTRLVELPYQATIPGSHTRLPYQATKLVKLLWTAPDNCLDYCTGKESSAGSSVVQVRVKSEHALLYAGPESDRCNFALETRESLDMIER